MGAAVDPNEVTNGVEPGLRTRRIGDQPINSVIEDIYRWRNVPAGEDLSHKPSPTAINRDRGLALCNLVRSILTTVSRGGPAPATLLICQSLLELEVGCRIAIDHMIRTTYLAIGLMNLERAGLIDPVGFSKRLY